MPDELASSLGGAAGSDEVIDDHDALAGLEGVGVDVELTLTVLEAVFDGHALAGQLPGLANRHQRQVEAVGQRRAEEEAPRLDGDDRIDIKALDVALQLTEGLVDRGGFWSRGVMSRKRMPGNGKSGMSRTSVLRSIFTPGQNKNWLPRAYSAPLGARHKRRLA